MRLAHAPVCRGQEHGHRLAVGGGVQAARLPSPGEGGRDRRVQKLGPWEAGAIRVGEGSLTIGAPAAGVAVAAPAGTVIVSADTGAAAESLGVVRQGDVDGLSDQASRGGLAARLSANQRILLVVILIAAVFPVLPPEAQMTRGWLQL